MNAKSLQTLIRKAQNDPSFFHDLVFDPEKIKAQLEELDEISRKNILQNKGESVIGSLVAHLSGDCSCTTGTCGGTCGGSTCSVTCSNDSCGRTCDNSCGYTTDFQFVGESFRSFGR
jgi:hypothetical protein